MEKRGRRSCASGTHWTCSSPSGPGYPWSLTWQYSACKCPVRKKTTSESATCCCRVEFRDGWIVANRGFESRLQETDKNILVFISICYRFPLPLELWRQITWEVLPLFRYTSWLKLSRPLKIANDICVFWGDQCITLIFPTQRTQWSWHVLARRGSWS